MEIYLILLLYVEKTHIEHDIWQLAWNTNKRLASAFNTFKLLFMEKWFLTKSPLRAFALKPLNISEISGVWNKCMHSLEYFFCTLRCWRRKQGLTLIWLPLFRIFLEHNKNLYNVSRVKIMLKASVN